MADDAPKNRLDHYHSLGDIELFKEYTEKTHSGEVQAKIKADSERSKKLIEHDLGAWMLKPEGGGKEKHETAGEHPVPSNYRVDTSGPHSTMDAIRHMFLEHTRRKPGEGPTHAKHLEDHPEELDAAILGYFRNINPKLELSDLVHEVEQHNGDIYAALTNEKSMLHQLYNKMATLESKHGSDLSYMEKALAHRATSEDTLDAVIGYMGENGNEAKFRRNVNVIELGQSSIASAISKGHEITHEHYLTSAHILKKGEDLIKAKGEADDKGEPGGYKKAVHDFLAGQ